MQTVEIPGGTATLRSLDEVKVRGRRLVEVAGVAAYGVIEKVQKAQKAGKADLRTLNLSADEVRRLFEVQDATIVATLDSWTRPEPLPTVDTVGDLDQPLYDILAEATREQGAALASRVDFSPHPDQPGFDASPTSRSGGSEPSLSADQEPGQLTEPSPSVGESTASAAPSLASPTTTT